MFQNYHLRLSTFKNTRPGQEVSGWLYQTRSSSMMRTRKKRFVKLDGHQLIVFDSETGELKQNVYLSDGRIDRGEADRLLLVLTVKTKKLLLIAESDREFEKWFTAFQYVFKKLEHYYEPGNLIGRGAFSTVHRGRMRQRVDGDPLVAIKIVQNTSDHRFLNNNEIEILADVRHENIVKTYDVFESKEETYIVMEYMRGGQLYDVIAEAESFSERTSRGVLRNILLGIRYLHFRGIVHRDLKPENLLCTNRSINRSISPAVKIADFGLSAYLGPDRGEMLNTLVGSPGYVAPELLQQQPYSKPVDIWAVGIIFYQMLTSLLPYTAESTREYLEKAEKGPVFRGPEWEGISDDAKSLIRRLLSFDPLERPTADEALNHPFFASLRLSSQGIAAQRRSRLHSSKRFSTGALQESVRGRNHTEQALRTGINM